MADSPSNGATSARRPRGRRSPGLRAMFSGYYLPADDDVRSFVTGGLVVLDANALLDVYRFTPDARKEYLRALEQVGDRLFVPYRSAEEFFDRRTTVMRSHRAERAQFETDMADAGAIVLSYVVDYCRRRGLSRDHIDEISTVVEGAYAQVFAALDHAGDPGATTPEIVHADPGQDPIVAEVEAIISAKVGSKFTVEQLAHLQKEHQKRMVAKLPPGYADGKKGDRAIGDYLVWEQALTEAESAQLPVLMVSNEQKEDWVRRDGDYIGPRPELVAEMASRSGQKLHLVDVHSFLMLAKEHLDVEISDDTVDQAGRLVEILHRAQQPTADVGERFAALAGMRGTDHLRALTDGIRFNVDTADPRLGELVTQVLKIDVPHTLLGDTTAALAAAANQRLASGLAMSDMAATAMRAAAGQSSRQRLDEEE